MSREAKMFVFPLLVNALLHSDNKKLNSVLPERLHSSLFVSLMGLTSLITAVNKSSNIRR